MYRYDVRLKLSPEHPSAATDEDDSIERVVLPTVYAFRALATVQIVPNNNPTTIAHTSASAPYYSGTIRMRGYETATCSRDEIVYGEDFFRRRRRIRVFYDDQYCFLNVQWRFDHVLATSSTTTATDTVLSDDDDDDDDDDYPDGREFLHLPLDMMIHSTLDKTPAPSSTTILADAATTKRMYFPASSQTKITSCPQMDDGKAEIYYRFDIVTLQRDDDGENMVTTTPAATNNKFLVPEGIQPTLVPSCCLQSSTPTTSDETLSRMSTSSSKIILLRVGRKVCFPVVRFCGLYDSGQTRDSYPLELVVVDNNTSSLPEAAADDDDDDKEEALVVFPGQTLRVQLQDNEAGVLFLAHCKNASISFNATINQYRWIKVKNLHTATTKASCELTTTTPATSGAGSSRFPREFDFTIPQQGTKFSALFPNYAHDMEFSPSYPEGRIMRTWHEIIFHASESPSSSSTPNNHPKFVSPVLSLRVHWKTLTTEGNNSSSAVAARLPV
jgi:hypothetical protein